MANDAIPAANADLLAAQAKSGMDGVQAYKQAQDALSAQRQSAVQTAMQEAALRGAPAGAAQSQSSIITQPYDDRIASLTQNQAAFTADMASRDRRMADYNSAVDQARTLIPGEVEMAVAPIRAQGQANIANTTRQGEMAVDQINANNQLALTRMQAAEQAAQIAAAKAAAKAKADSMKLTQPQLTAMLSSGALAHMQTTGAAADIAPKNVAGAKTAQTAFDQSRTAEIAQGQKNRLQNLNEGQPRDQIHVPLPATALPVAAPAGSGPVAAKPVPPARVPGQPPEAYQAALDVYKQRLAQWTALQAGGVPSPFASTTPFMAPAVPSAPAVNPADLFSSRTATPTQNFTAKLPALGSQPMPVGVAAPAVAPLTGAAQAQALALAKQQQAAALAKSKQTQATGGQYQPGMNSLVSAMGAAGTANNPTNFSGQYGSFTADQFAQLQKENPWLATVIAGAPEKITGSNFASLIAGEPDLQGQTSTYSHQVSQAATEQAALDLQGQGYQFSPADVQQAMGLDMKPGETLAQYQERTTGQLSPKDQAAAVAKQQADKRQAVADARADYNFQQQLAAQEAKYQEMIGGTGETRQQLSDDELIAKHNQFLATTNPNGSPKIDPGETDANGNVTRPSSGLPVTATPKDIQAGSDAAQDQTASAHLLQYLPYLPDKSKYGTPYQVATTVETGGTGTDANGNELPKPVLLYNLMQTKNTTGTGMSAKDFSAAYNSSKGASQDLWGSMNASQRDLLKLYLYDPTKK